MIGVGALGASATLAGSATARQQSLQNPPSTYETLRGSVQEPVDGSAVDDLRDSYSDGGTTMDSESSSRLYLDVEESFSDVRIVGYNILTDDAGNVREQFVTAGPERYIPDGPGVRSAGNSRLDSKADELLERAGSTDAVSTEDATTQNDWDVDWSDWSYFGSDDIYHEEFTDTEISDAKPGAVEFTNEVRNSWEDDRIAARSKIRMEPGRELCKDGFDEYCTSGTVHTGWRNREARVYLDWDQPWNTVDTDDLLVSTDPEGQVEDVSTTRGVSMGLDLSKDPGLSIGYNSSVTMNGAYLRDRTTKRSGRSDHEFKITSSRAESAKYPAVFEVGSVSRYDTDCGGMPIPTTALNIDVDLRWGLRLPRIGWMNSHRDDKSFSYTRYC
ncbi:hypothetical protein EA473_05495 [Natrarchaeobius chitinivorans]|uniref:Uncharacterized protein n=2 Tax=Natrarchaeobius chitinivorans TaxID=1679083 RepID=A0A3N6PFW8_NATCH|nr:hypothetical protein EA473_05495 [Natrarchaeobius chitinivorans]